jgi:hypothetical protein
MVGEGQCEGVKDSQRRCAVVKVVRESEGAKSKVVKERSCE